MSIHSCNDYIESLGYTLEDWARLSEEEQTATLRDYFENEGLTTEEIEEAKTQLKEDLDKVREELEECADELDDLESGATEEESEEIEELLEKLDALEEELDEIKDLTVDVLDDLREHNIDGTDGRDIPITTLNLDGRTYTYNLSSGAAGPFGGGGAGSDREWLLEEGYINAQGHAIKEKDGVDGLTYNDIEAALAERQELAETQNITISTTGNKHWILVGADEATGTITFRVESGDEFSIVTFTNAANAVFFFTTGLSGADVDLIKGAEFGGTGPGWTEWFQRNAYWGDSEGSPKSFWEELHPLSDEERYSAIAGYRDVIETQPGEVAPYTDPGTVDEEQLREIENKIFDYLDSGSTQPIPEFWAEILQNFTGDKSLMLQQLIVTFYLKSKALFAKFFAPVILQMEAILNSGIELDSEPTFGAKIAILLLETQTTGVGQYTADTIIQTLFGSTAVEGSVTNDGLWKDNDVNARVLPKINALIAQGGTPLAGIREALAVETERAGTVEVQLTEDQYDAISRKVSNYNYQDLMLDTAGSDSSYSDGVDFTELRDRIKEICLKLTEQEYTVEDMRAIILNWITSLDHDEMNDIANVLVHLLHDFSPELLTALTSGSEGTAWANEMWGLVSQGDRYDSGDAFSGQTDYAERTWESQAYLNGTALHQGGGSVTGTSNALETVYNYGEGVVRAIIPGI